MADQGTGGQRPAGWKKDPSGRHFGRFWDGTQWTEHVISADKVQSVDPLPPRPEPSIFDDSAPPPAPPQRLAPPQRPAPAPAPTIRGPVPTAAGWTPQSNGRRSKDGGVLAAVRGWPRWAKWAAGVGLVVVVIAAAGAGSDDDQKTVVAGQPATTVAEGSPVVAPEPSNTKATPAATAATQPADPQARLQAAVTKALGSGRKGVTRLNDIALTDNLTISWAIGEGLTEGLTKDKARREAVQILETVRKEGVNYGTLTLVGSYALVDRLGNSSEDTVVRAVYSKATVDRINFSGFDFKNAFTIASPVTIHPSFQY